MSTYPWDTPTPDEDLAEDLALFEIAEARFLREARMKRVARHLLNGIRGGYLVRVPLKHGNLFVVARTHHRLAFRHSPHHKTVSVQRGTSAPICLPYA